MTTRCSLTVDGKKQGMYEIIKILDEKHVTPTREMVLILAKCSHCGEVQKILEQNVKRANRQKRKHCSMCIGETFHRMTNTRIWGIWHGMIQRTTRVYGTSYDKYGGRGIGVCDRWLDFKNFYEDMGSSYKDDLTLDRIDNEKGYSKENCRWVSNMKQQSNKRNNRLISFRGQEMHLAEYCRQAGVTRGAISPRLNAGMSGDEALEDYRNSKYPKGRKSRTYTT